MNAQNIFPCSLCESDETLDFENLKTHLRDFHQILHTQKQTFLLALIVVEFDHDDILQKLMTQMQERVEGMLSNEDREDRAEEPVVDVQDDDEIREDLKEEILKQTETYDVDNIQQKIREDLDSDGDEEDDNIDPGDDPTVMVNIKEEPQETPEQVVTEEVNRLNLYERFKKMNLCRLCYSKFEDEKAIQKHEEEEHTDDQEALHRTHFTFQDLIHKCSVCPTLVAFLTLNLLIKHEESQHKRKVRPSNGITCKLCYKIFKKEQLLLVHYDSVHKGDPHLDVKIRNEDLKHSCSDCSYRFVSESLLRNHQQASHEFNVKNFYDIKTKSYKCKLCHLSFNYPFKILNHINNYHSGDKEILKDITEEDYVKQCDKCDLRFISEKLMDFHRLKVHFPTEKKIPCSACGKKISRYNVSAHKSLMHSDKPLKDSKPISSKDTLLSSQSGECHLCLTIMKNKYQLPKHMKSVHMKYRTYWKKKIPESELLASCKECNSSLLNESLLDMHMKIVHRKKINIGANCPLCHKTLKEKYHVKAHLSKMHKHEKEYWFKEIPKDALKYSCQDCSSYFVSKNCRDLHNAAAHMSLISDSQCHLCLKSIKEKKMKIHLKNAHRKESQYWFKRVPDEQLKIPCPDCSNKFVSKTSLQLHKTASHEKKIERADCHLCYRELRDKYYLKPHLKNMHKDLKEYWFTDVPKQLLVHPCKKCDKVFISKDLLKLHNSWHIIATYDFLRKPSFSVETQKFTCKLCLKSYLAWDNLKNHFNNVHQDDIELLKKETLEEEDFTFSCTVTDCPKRYPAQSSLNYHIKVNHCLSVKSVKKESKFKEKKSKLVKLESRERYCQLCNILYKKPHFFQTHKNKVHSCELDAFEKEIGLLDLTHQCSKCFRSFYSENTLAYHHHVKHYTGKVTHCTLCDYDFKNPVKYSTHKYKVHKFELDLFKKELIEDNFQQVCSECPKKFATKSSLDFHSKVMHKKLSTLKKEGEGERHCKLCLITYKKSFFFDAHKKNVHAAELDAFNKDYTSSEMIKKCFKCSKRYATEGSLMFHIKSKHHSSTLENKFECSLCYQKFKFISKLTSHTKHAHPQDIQYLNKTIPDAMKIFSCGSCDLKFVSSKTQEYHFRKTHTSMVTFCKLCCYNFPDIYSLKRHKKNYHKSEEEIQAFNVKPETLNLKETCKFCNFKFLNSNCLRYHVTYKHKEERKKDVKCDYCNVTFQFNNNRDRTIKKHMKNVHGVKDETDKKQVRSQKNMTVENFMNFFNSLTQ